MRKQKVDLFENVQTKIYRLRLFNLICS